MIRIVCPSCHSPLSVSELETATFDNHVCLVCPECSSVLVTETEADLEEVPATQLDLFADA